MLMLKNSLKAAAIALMLLAGYGLSSLATSAAAQPPTITRKILLQHDLAIPRYEATMIAQEIPVGGREGKHTHPGMLVAYIQEGALTVEYEGKPAVTYKAGDTFYEPSGCVHRVTRNPSARAKTRLLAVILHPRDAKEVTVPEKGKE